MPDMTEPLLTVRLRRGRVFTIIGKALVAILIGAVIGLKVASNQVKMQRHAEGLTREQYAADYEAYRARLLQGHGQAAAVLAGVVFLGVTFAIYELAGYGIAWGLGQLADRGARQEPAAPSDGGSLTSA